MAVDPCDHVSLIAAVPYTASGRRAIPSPPSLLKFCHSGNRGRILQCRATVWGTRTPFGGGGGAQVGLHRDSAAPVHLWCAIRVSNYTSDTSVEVLDKTTYGLGLYVPIPTDEFFACILPHCNILANLHCTHAQFWVIHGTLELMGNPHDSSRYMGSVFDEHWTTSLIVCTSWNGPVARTS